MKKINIDIKYLVSLLIILVIAIIPTYSHHGHLIIDCGREAYYPTQILLGKILYKDIFNIYGPFSYMFNALLFKLFTINLNVLYLSGCVCAALITVLTYLISIRFLPKFLSFAIAVFTIFTGVITTYFSNFIFPYSFAMLYGLVAFLASVLFLLKYQANFKISNLYLSCFFAGLCISNKYEFIPYLLVILYAIIYIKPLKFKEYYYAIFSLVFIPIFCFGILFLQGLKIHDLIYLLTILKKMSQSQTLIYFYRRQGVYFSNVLMQYEIKFTLMTLIALACFMYGFISKRKIFSNILIILSSLLILKWTMPLSFSLLPIITVIFAILNFKNMQKNFPLQLLTLSAIVFSFKEFWCLIIANYGTFFAGFLIITLLALIKEKFSNKNINYNAIAIYLILISVAFARINWKGINNYKIKSSRGGIYTTKQLYLASKDLISYIEKNTKKSDKIVIFPEGAMINFLTDRPTDDFYTSLIPLYVETFGEKNIIKHFSASKPEYIIFNNWDTSDYYFHNICNDYAVSFCNFVATNYTQEKIIDTGARYLIFKRKTEN